MKIHAIQPICEVCGAQTTTDKAHIYHGGMGGKVASSAQRGNGCDCPVNIVFLCRRCHSRQGAQGWNGLLAWMEKHQPQWRCALVKLKLSRARDHYYRRSSGNCIPCTKHLKSAWGAAQRKRRHGTSPYHLIYRAEHET